jgi:ribosomal protein L40E
MVFVVVAAAIIIGSILLYRNALGRMVECGECGALVPEASKRCPKCGVEFETGTAKCSQCGAWIPANSTECPECGAKFVNQPLAEEESEYIKKMRQEYELHVDQYREQAKGVLGKKYSEPKFQEWWKKQTSFITFEKWLAQEEDKRKSTGGAFPCPVCGTLNPKGSTVCHKCGTVFEKTISGEPLQGAEQPQQTEAKPTRRIVRRPAEKKMIPKKPEEGVPPEGQSSEPGPEDQPKP